MYIIRIYYVLMEDYFCRNNMPGPRRFSSGGVGGGGQAWEMGERRYSVAGTDPHLSHHAVTSMGPPASEDLHAWSIYR